MIRRKKIVRFKNCTFCKEKKEPDYKEVAALESFLSERGKILSRMITGTCAKHQKKISREVKKARFLALLPYFPSFKNLKK